MDSLPQELWLKIVLLVAAILACGLFSFIETAITTLRLFDLKELAKKNLRYTQLFYTLEHNPQRVLIAILIANCLVNVIAADLITDAIQTMLATLHFSPTSCFVLSVAIATAAILIFGDVLPKNIAQARSDSLLQSVLWIVQGTFFIMRPLVYLLSGFSQFVIRKLKPDHTGSSVVSEQEIQFLIDHINKNGLMDKDKSQMLHSIFDLADTTIREIMVSEADVVSLNINASLEEALELFTKYHYSRLPVYEDQLDNIIGMIHQKDLFLLLSKEEKKPLRDLLRPILFVPEGMKVNQLLRQFKQQRHHIAMVLNEYGGVIGLVTLEDALEEIVGDINDEHELISEHIVALEQGGWLVYGGVDLEELAEALNIEFPTEHAVTLGGFLTERLEHVPYKGEEYIYSDFIFLVQKATPKRVIQVLITPNIK